MAYKRHCNTKVKTNASRQKVRRQLPIRQFALLRWEFRRQWYMENQNIISNASMNLQHGVRGGGKERKAGKEKP